MKTRHPALFLTAGLCIAALSACEPNTDDTNATARPDDHEHEHDHDHEHAEGSDPHAEETDPNTQAHDEDHDHDETPLGSITMDDITIDCYQGNGSLEAGEEMHLIINLPYNDSGATIVRAWIGTEDRLASIVGRGEYAASHDAYDIHAEAPDPLPANAMWWIEIERPDGTKTVGSIEPR